MNCNAGDRAVVVRAHPRDACTRSMIGAIVIVKMPIYGGEWHWEVDKAVLCENCGGWRWDFRDADLQPIRDRGTGDEMPAPPAELKTIAPASA